MYNRRILISGQIQDVGSVTTSKDSRFNVTTAPKASPIWASFGPNQPHLAEFGPQPAKSGPVSAKIVRFGSNLRHVCPSSDNIRLSSQDCGQIRDKVGRIWATRVHIRAKLGRHCPILADAGQSFFLIRPKLAQVGPNSAEITFGQNSAESGRTQRKSGDFGKQQAEFGQDTGEIWSNRLGSKTTSATRWPQIPSKCQRRDMSAQIRHGTRT